jgi:hypothetical protein
VKREAGCICEIEGGMRTGVCGCPIHNPRLPITAKRLDHLERDVLKYIDRNLYWADQAYDLILELRRLREVKP